ncbi:MAG: thiamine biosynthesis protein ThiS [Cyanobacterium sp. T60_A2020_053]|nr:thiamine biosynthesis protein ThiS [Cyanobacterium sp. T60_A2020_053]
MNQKTITISVNGEEKIISAPFTLSQTLTNLNFQLRLIAVEYNGEILHRQYWDTTMVKAGDKLEVVTIVGGG